ncbi:MAG: hypothetical protein HFI73_02235 [Bacilli bacterium]|jgi:hypothetical protein|nr:hypothetical protein [Bacilli bacterium]
MQANLVSCLFILDSEKNGNIRKNDIKKIKILVTDEEELPEIPFKAKGIKNQIKKNISSIIGSDYFHVEQVFSYDHGAELDVIYLGITNMENIIKLKKGYKLIEFKVENNNTIIFGDKKFKYKTIENIENKNIEYTHEIQAEDNIKLTLLKLLITYKKIRSSLDNTDMLFKFMGGTFTLEDVRIVYELIKDTSVDKSNFRKKIIKYCEKVEEKKTEKKGYRPSQKYSFKPLKGDVWL